MVFVVCVCVCMCVCMVFVVCVCVCMCGVCVVCVCVVRARVHVCVVCICGVCVCQYHPTVHLPFFLTRSRAYNFGHRASLFLAEVLKERANYRDLTQLFIIRMTAEVSFHLHMQLVNYLMKSLSHVLQQLNIPMVSE